MKGTKNYDGDLQMFRETPKAVDLAHLTFLRWLVEQGRLEHPPAGPPSGPLVTGELVEVEEEQPLIEAA